MKKVELLEILNKMNMTPSKRFGQNFMIDDNLLNFIVRQAEITPGELIVEIGPGCGVLTEKILEQEADLIAVELDKRIHEYLSSTLTSENFTLIQGDACRIDFPSLFQTPEKRKKYGTGNWKCIANLPYSISSPFIARIIELESPPKQMLFLLQKETGDRFAASPGTSNYGSLSVMIQTVFDVKYVRTVPPDVFFPKPDVKSALLDFRRKDSFPDTAQIRQLSKTVRMAFSQRRKKMIKALSSIFGKEQCLAAFKELGIDENIRAEKLSPSEFMKLAKTLQ